jgi:hypothetical protein
MRYVLINENKDHLSPPLTGRQLSIWCRENLYRADAITSSAYSLPVLRDTAGNMLVVVAEKVAAMLLLVARTRSSRLILPT